MDKKKDIGNLASMVKSLFEEKLGSFGAEDFFAVGRELGFDLAEAPGDSGREDVEYTYHSKKQPGEGFWAVAQGAGDISEGMVWVSKKPS